MFESLQPKEVSETQGLDDLGEEYELRRLQPLNNYFLLPAAGILTFVVFLAAGLPRLLLPLALCLIYGALSVPTLLIYDRVTGKSRTFSDYFLLGLGVLRDSLRFVLVAAVTGLISLFTSF